MSIELEVVTPVELEMEEASMRGPQGPKGDQGEKGDKGDKGDTGSTGATGPTGPKGDTGATGEQGIQGNKGDKGDAGIGIASITFKNTDEAGNNVYLITLTDSKTYTFTANRGPKGDVGLKGDKGDTGDQGPKGAQGVQGIQGIQGAKGDKGLTGDTGPQGPQGEVGPQGEQGKQGVQGNPGNDGVGINSVVYKEEKANGDKVYTINLSDSTTYDFIVPKGAKGNKGEPFTYEDLTTAQIEELAKDISSFVGVPTKTSELTNDSNFVSDANYQHTDNNFTDALLTKLNGLTKITKVSELENDEGFLKEHQSLSGYATEQWVEGKDYLPASHNISPAAHSDIRELITGLTTRLNALADSDDTTLDQLSEIVAYIKANRSLIESITTSKVSVSDIVDNLTSTATNKPLSAKQGMALKALIDAIVIPTKLSDLQDDIKADNIFIATYGTTTAEEIGAAYAAGKATFCKKNNQFAPLASRVNKRYVFTFSYGNQNVMWQCNNDNWSTLSIAVPSITTTTATLTVDGWEVDGDELKQTVAVSNLPISGYIYTTYPNSSQYKAWTEAGIYADDVTTANSITFHCTEKPTVAVSVNIKKEQVG